MERPLITIGFDKGEMDFGVNCSISDLTLEQMNKLRIMAVVALSESERMWHKNEPKPYEDKP